MSGRPRRNRYIKASPVTVTHADGTVDTQRALNPAELNKVIGAGNRQLRRHAAPIVTDAEIELYRSRRADTG